MRWIMDSGRISLGVWNASMSWRTVIPLWTRAGTDGPCPSRQRTEENGVFGMMIDKTDAYKEIVRLRNISQHDQLTGLYNAAYLKKEGQKILDDNRNMVNALVFCDLDNLKYINDNFGHEMGDRYLKAMADMLADMAAQEQCVAVRLSGG